MNIELVCLSCFIIMLGLGLLFLFAWRLELERPLTPACILCHNLVSKLSQSVRGLLAILIGNLLHVTTCNHGDICHFLQVDSHNIIPCWQASPKLEYGARTIRPKIHNQMREFLTEFPPVIKHPHAGKASIKVTSYFWNSL